MHIPYIDPSVKVVGPAKLRELDSAALVELKDVLLIQHKEQRLAVLLPYEIYLQLQESLVAKQDDLPREQLLNGIWKQ